VRGVIFVAVHQHLRDIGDEELRKTCFPEPSSYLAFRDYPESDLLHIAQLIAQRLPSIAPPLGDVLRSLGEEVPPVLKRTAPALLPKATGLQAVLEMLDGRETNARIVLPRLQALTDADSRVSLLHLGGAALCRFDEGLLIGLAATFGERLVMRQPECRQRKDERCLFIPRIAAGEPGRPRHSMTVRFGPRGEPDGDKGAP